MTDSSTSVIRIASRGSALARWQAEHVAGLIRAVAPEYQVQIVWISTEGDRDRNTALATMGGQGVFTKEVQTAVLEARADLAVHSLKDLPTEPAEGLTLGAVPERAPVHDALILPVTDCGACPTGRDGEELLRALPPGARIGTGSLRRRAQLWHFRDDFTLLEIRGNLDTRLKKLDTGDYDAIVLAEAGLRRLGWADRVTALLTPPLMLHAVGQGALGIECRADDERTRDVLLKISHADVFTAVTAERALLRSLRAGCHAPVGVTSRVLAEQVELDGVVLSPDGRQRLFATAAAPRDQAAALGEQLAEQLRTAGADSLLQVAR